MRFLNKNREIIVFMCIYTFCFVYAKPDFESKNRLCYRKNHRFYVKTAQNTRQSVNGFNQKVKTHKYSQNRVDNEYLCEYNTAIANDQ